MEAYEDATIAFQKSHSMRSGIIVNPFSGGPKGPVPPGAARLEFARGLARRLDPAIEVIATAGPGHAAELAGQFVSRGFSRVIAWGGDGTINEAAGPLIGSGVELGLVPSGSGDGLARGLGLFRPAEAALAIAIAEPARPLDVGMLGDRHFLNIGGIGFDAAVAATFNNRSKRGHAGYLADSLLGVWSYRSRDYAVEVEGERFTGPRFVVAFANCREYGNGLVLVPNADPTDGRLDMVMVKGGSPFRQFWRARRLTWRRLAPAEGVRRGRIAAASVAGEFLQCHVDGQPFETSGTLNVSIKPGAVRVAGARPSSS
jgi:diacylglycerol kinase family enzyme